MNLILRLVIILVIVVAILTGGLLLTKDRLLRSSAIAAVEDATDFSLEIEKVELSVTQSSFLLKGVRLMNPEGFKAEEALVINEISADLKLLSLLTSTIRLNSAVVDIPQLTVETNPDGVNNLQLLQKQLKAYKDEQDARSGEDDAGEEGEEREGEEDDAPVKEIYIETLEVRLGTADIVDYSKGEEAAGAEVNLNVDKTYREVDDINDVVIDLTATVIQKAFIGLMGQDLGDFLDNLGDKSSEGGKKLKEEAGELEDQLKGFLKQFR